MIRSKLSFDNFKALHDQLKDEGSEPRFMRSSVGSAEIVLVLPLSNAQELHIYTNLEDDSKIIEVEQETPVILHDVISNINVPFSLPTSLNENYWQWIVNCIRAADTKVGFLSSCDKCGAHKVKKQSRSYSTFMGCSAYPACGKGGLLKNAYPLFDLDGGTKTVPHQKFPSSQVLNPPRLDSPVNQYTNLVGMKERHPTDSFTFLDYTPKFPLFNRLQSTVLAKKYHRKRNNLLLGARTSTGKTIAAEIIAAPLLEKGAKMIYVSPYLSLSQERMQDWTTGIFKDYSIVQLTGDTLTDSEEREKQMRRAAKANIVIMTSELLDSISRKVHAHNEQYTWLEEVAIVIVDEIHIVAMKGRGDAVEVGLMRFCKHFPQAKIVALSATLPNVTDFQQWLTLLNGRPTAIINSKWRPTLLKWHFIQSSPPSLLQHRLHKDSMIHTLLECLLDEEKQGQKWLIFVHTKAIGRKLVPILNKMGFTAQFHNADLDKNQRQSIESRFDSQDGDLQVLVSTSTLAWGRNLPARNVVIFGTYRANTEVDILDIIQMGGRAGRLGRDPRGDVYLILKENESSLTWEGKVRNARFVNSTLMQPQVLLFHFLAEIANGVIIDHDSAQKWADRTLASLQMDISDNLISTVFAQLLKWGMIRQYREGVYNITKFGRISSDFYVEPRDMLHWDMFGRIMSQNNLWKDPIAISWLIGGTPSLNPPWPARDDEILAYSYQCTQDV